MRLPPRLLPGKYTERKWPLAVSGFVKMRPDGIPSLRTNSGVAPRTDSLLLPLELKIQPSPRAGITTVLHVEILPFPDLLHGLIQATPSTIRSSATQL